MIPECYNYAISIALRLRHSKHFSNPLILKNWLETQWQCIKNVNDEDEWFAHIERDIPNWTCSTMLS